MCKERENMGVNVVEKATISMKRSCNALLGRRSKHCDTMRDGNPIEVKISRPVSFGEKKNGHRHVDYCGLSVEKRRLMTYNCVDVWLASQQKG